MDKQDQASGFIKRWSRRKIITQSEIKEDLKNDSVLELSNADEAAGLVTEPPSETEAVEYKTDADMLPLEQLTAESDYSDFLSPKVSEALRKQALRKLFHMPFLNIVDGLDDYAEDYTKFAALGDIIPHEMMRMLEREKAKELADAKEAELSDENKLADTKEELELTSDKNIDTAKRDDIKNETDADTETIDIEQEIVDNKSLPHL